MKRFATTCVPLRSCMGYFLTILIAITILGHMHYGRDDVVIAASLAMMIGGVAVSLVVTPLLERARR